MQNEVRRGSGDGDIEFKVIQIPQPLFPPTNVMRIGDTLIDTGHTDDASTKVLSEQFESGELRGVKRVIITHPHVDHVTASLTLPWLGELPHTMFVGADKAVRNITEYLTAAQHMYEDLLAFGDDGMRPIVHAVAQNYWPSERHYGDLNIARVVGPWEEIQADAVILKVVETPGHQANHMALFHEASGTIFTGDMITNSGQFSVAPTTPDIHQYEKSVRRILELRPKTIVPSHGEIIKDAVEHLHRCLDNVKRMKASLMEIMEKRREASLLQITADKFNESDPMKSRVMAVGVMAYLECLEKEGRLSIERERLMVCLV